jgi:hypothetical protein
VPACRPVRRPEWQVRQEPIPEAAVVPKARHAVDLPELNKVNAQPSSAAPCASARFGTTSSQSRRDPTVTMTGWSA